MIGAEAEILRDGDRIALPPHTPYTLHVLGDKSLLWLIAQKKKK